MDNKIINSRSNFENLGTLYKMAEDIIIENEIIEGVSCYWFCKKSEKTGNKVIIYLHGGCFVLGSINSHKALVSHFTSELDSPILFIEYSLAPENPFPAAINDILKVYEHIVFKMQMQNVSFIGDSAGAALSVSVVSNLNKRIIRKPRHLVMLSPWIDLNCSSSSIIDNADIDPILTEQQLQFYTSLYIGKTNLSVANPIETLFGDFPPTLILVGANEILLDDSKKLYAKISEIQPLTKLSIYDKQTHVWLLDSINTKSSKKAFAEIRNFIDDKK
jgi:epsilon-lactone hydrolase